MNNELIRLDSLSPEQLQIIHEQIIGIRMKMYEAKFAQMDSKIKKQEQELEIIKEENENLRDMEIKRHRMTEHRYGFISLSDLGQCYSVSIGSKTMGKLLRLAGIAKAKQSKTEPYRDMIVNNYAKSQMYGDNITYQWNPEKCIEKIDRWLDKVGVINEFYNIEDEDKLTKYISELDTMYA